jgi:hypothetical protein
VSAHANRQLHPNHRAWLSYQCKTILSIYDLRGSRNAFDSSNQSFLFPGTLAFAQSIQFESERSALCFFVKISEAEDYFQKRNLVLKSPHLSVLILDKV